MKISKKKGLFFLGVFLLTVVLLFFGSCYLLRFFMNTHTNPSFGLVETFDSNVKYMNGVDVIYWINLDRSTERRQHMESIFTDPVFSETEIIRFSAVDGQKEDAKSMVKTADQLFRSMSNVEYACLLSHLKTISAFANSDKKNNVALIFEDDITLELKKYWKKSTKQIIMEAPPDWEVIQLCYIGHGDGCVIVPTVDYDTTIYPSAAAYLINRKGASKISRLFINGQYNVERSVYPIADLFIFGHCKTYTCKYPMFIYKGDTSTLHDEDLKCHNSTKKWVLNMMEKDIGS